jgi:hypothetical protein
MPTPGCDTSWLSLLLHGLSFDRARRPPGFADPRSIEAGAEAIEAQQMGVGSADEGERDATAAAGTPICRFTDKYF